MTGFLTIEQAAVRVNRSTRTIRRWLEEGLTIRAGYIREDELLEAAKLWRSRHGRPRQVESVLAEVAAERARQDRKWGEQNYPDGTGPTDQAKRDRAEAQAATDREATRYKLTWRHVLIEEVFEALAEDDPALLRAELIQVAAVAAAWVEAIDRRGASNG